jgi:hypothetical protein
MNGRTGASISTRSRRSCSGNHVAHVTCLTGRLIGARPPRSIPTIFRRGIRLVRCNPPTELAGTAPELHNRGRAFDDVFLDHPSSPPTTRTRRPRMQGQHGLPYRLTSGERRRHNLAPSTPSIAPITRFNQWLTTVTRQDLGRIPKPRDSRVRPDSTLAHRESHV